MLTCSPTPIPKLANWILVMNGIHVFCGPQLYTAPYGTKEGGWFGLVLLFLYFGFTLASADNIGLLLNEDHSIKRYPTIGKATCGRWGINFVVALVCLLSFASAVESAMIDKDILEYFHSGEITLLGYTTNQYKVILYGLCGIMLIIVWLVPDLERHDLWLTVTGVILNIVAVCCLCWLAIFHTVEVEEGKPVPTTKFVRPRNWPIASGFYAYCFSGHPYLPELFHRLKKRIDYRKILYFIFVPTLILYLLAACVGYGKFGSNVESIYILNMPKDLYVSWIAAHVTVVHMMIRYVLGIYGVLKTLEEEMSRNSKRYFNPFWTSFINSFLVLITIPLTILIKNYGPVMALLGSILGIGVALLIPYAFITNIRISRMNRFQILFSIIILLLAGAAAVVGAVDSIKEIKNGG